ncbi:MAG: porin [Planctomycetaceae bacterium]
MRKFDIKSWMLKAGRIWTFGGFALMLSVPAFAGDGSCCTGPACTDCNDCAKIYADAAEKLKNLEVPCCTTGCCSTDSCGVGCCGSSCGCDGGPCFSLMDAFDNECGGNWMEDNGLSFTGWVEAGITFNPEQSNNNQPVGFNNRANDLMLNQLYFILSKDAAANECEFGWGGQIDFLFGHDSDDTSTFGGRDGSWDNDWTDNSDGDIDNMGIAMPQIYASFYAPIGNGVTVDVGHFYTIIGYEVVPATGNFFYSHAYTMQFGEPFTHTGIKANTDLTDNINVTAGIVTGWDDWENEYTSNSFLGGVTWTSDSEATSVAFAIISGDEINFSGNDESHRNMYSIVVTQALSDKLTYVFQHDRGSQNGLVAGEQQSEWYGINQYLFYDLDCKNRVGLNYEWFRDDDGSQLGNGAANYYVLRAGLNHKLYECVTVRPEVRWDWADNGARPYDNGEDGSQFTFGTDVIWTY